MTCTEAKSRKTTLMTPSTQNLNAKLSARTRRNGTAPAQRSRRRGAAPPVRIAGARSSWQGGYRVNV